MARKRKSGKRRGRRLGGLSGLGSTFLAEIAGTKVTCRRYKKGAAGFRCTTFGVKKHYKRGGVPRKARKAAHIKSRYSYKSKR